MIKKRKSRDSKKKQRRRTQTYANNNVSRFGLAGQAKAQTIGGEEVGRG